MKPKFAGLAVLLLAAVVATAAELGVGSPREDVVSVLGKPKATMWKGGTEILYYSGGAIDVRSGKVVRLDAGFDTIIRQRAKGLVKYDGRWITPEEAARLDDAKRKGLQEAQAKASAPGPKAGSPGGRAASGGAPAGGKVAVIANGGKAVDLGSLLVPGKVTIIDFYADWCGPCRALSPFLEGLTSDPDVYLCKVDIVNWGSEVAKQYGLSAIPNVRVYDRQGNMVGSPTHSGSEVQALVQRAK